MQRFDIWYVASPSGPLPSLFILCPGVKTGPAPGVTSWNMSQVGTQKQRKKISKFFFSETGRPRALIFGISHLLEDLYQVCSYDAPDVKTGPAPGVTSWKIGTKKPIFKVFFFFS